MLSLISNFANTGFKWPSHSQIQFSLSFMAHSYHLETMLDWKDIDLLIRPDEIGQYKIMDYDKLAQIERLGFKHGDTQLRRFLHDLSSEHLDRLQTITTPLPGSSASLSTSSWSCGGGESAPEYLQRAESAPHAMCSSNTSESQEDSDHLSRGSEILRAHTV